MSRENKSLSILPEGVTQQMVDDAKAKFGVVKLAELYDADGNLLKTVVMNRPPAHTMNQFEKFLDREPARAKKILLKGCLLSSTEIADLPSNDELFNAAFDAAANMLPVGKSILKNL